GVDSLQRVRQLTGGHGLDGVLITAATNSSSPVNLAFDMLRLRGRVAIVGDVGLDLERHKMYRKELELRLSCSYGPGRYDPGYELEGRDYPRGHVRWTEQRNLEFFLDLLGSRRLDLSSLVSGAFPVTEAGEAYARIKQTTDGDYGILLDYGMPAGFEPPGAVSRVIRTAPSVRTSGSRKIQIGVIGVGAYARNVHLPNLRRHKDIYSIYGVAS